MTASDNKKFYESPETTVVNLHMSEHILAGSDEASTFSIGSNLGMDFGGGFDPSFGD